MTRWGKDSRGSERPGLRIPSIFKRTALAPISDNAVYQPQWTGRCKYIALRTRKERVARYFSAAAFALALVAGVFWLNYRSGELLKVNGLVVLVPLAIPVLVSSVPLVFERRAVRIMSAILLGVFSFLSSLSIGRCYIPSAVTMVISACLPSRNVRR